MSNPFDQFDTPAPRQTPRYETIRGRVDPYKAEDQSIKRDDARRKDEDQQRDEIKTGLAVESNDRADINSTFDNKAKLRNDYDKLPAVTAYRASIPMYSTALTTQNSAEGDLTLIKAYAKLTDPTTGVLNGEGQAVAESGPYFERTVQGLKNNLDASGMFADRARVGLRQELTRLMKNRNRAYNQARTDFSKMSESSGFDPQEIVRSHDGEPFRQTAREYEESLRDPNDSEATVQSSTRVGNDFEGAVGGMNSRGATTERIPIPKEMQAEYNAWLDSNGRGFDPQDYALMRMSLDRKYGYGVQNDTYARYAKEGKSYSDPKTNVNRSIPGVETPLSQIDQARNNLGRTDLVVAATTGINAATLGVPTLLAGQRGRDATDKMREDSPVPAYAGEILGGIAGAYGVGAGLGTVSRLAGLGETAAARATGDVAVNTVQGGLTSFNNSGGSVEQGIVGAALGGGITKGLQRAGSTLANTESAIAAKNIQDAADRQGVELMAGDTGGAFKGLLTAGLAQSPVASGTIVKGANRVNSQIGDVVDRLARSEGAPVRQEAFGDTVRTAAETFKTRSGRVAEREYGAAKAIDPGQRFTAQSARKVLVDQLTELAETPATSADIISGLRTIGKDIPIGKTLSVDAMQKLRTNVRSMAQSDTLATTDFERRAGIVLDELSSEFSKQMTPKKAAAFLKADRNYADRMTLLKDVIPEIIGPAGKRSSEMVARRLIGMSRSDSARTGQFIESLLPDEAGIVRGSIIKEMGRASPTNQNVTGDAFSLVEFNKVFNEMPDRTKAILFPSNARNIANDIAIIANGAKSARKYANTSNTAGALNAAALIGKAVSGGAAVKSLGLTIPVELITAQLMSHPRIIRSLANLVRINTPERRAAALAVLKGVAARAPATRVDEISDYIKGQK
jgi:hypothetical protein